MKRCHSIILALTSLLVLAGCETGGPIYRSDPVVQATMERLKTTDEAEIRRRWGDLADLLGKHWVFNPPNGTFNFFDARWKVPGAVIEMKLGGCYYKKCVVTDIVMLHKHGSRTFDFVMNDGERRYTGEVLDDGTVRVGYMLGSSVIDFKYIRGDNTFKSNTYLYRQGTRQEIIAATGVTLPEPDQLAATQSPASRSVVAQSPAQKSTGVPLTKAAQATPVQSGNDYLSAFPLLEADVPQKGKVIADKGSTKPAIFVIDAKAGQKLAITATASKFNPGISIYHAADRSKVDAKAGVSPLTMVFQPKQSGAYLVAVYSADAGKSGDFKLEASSNSVKPNAAPAQATSSAAVPMVASSAALPVAAPSNAPSPKSGKGNPSGKPLTFILTQSMQPGMKSKINPTCFSNVITVPGPEGFQTHTDWGGSAPGVVEKAIEMMKAYYPEFQQKCDRQADGQLQVKTYNSPAYDFNTKSEPERVQRSYSRMKSMGPEMLEVQIAPR